MSDSAPLIDVRGLTKTFWVAQHRGGAMGALRSLVERTSREVQAVAGISFEVSAGELIGFIGPNGAGKSTTIKMLTGILVPSAGQATVDGLVPWRQRKALARRIGVVFGQRTQLWWDLPLIESLRLLRYIYRVPEDRFADNLRTMRELLELDPFLETPVRQLSLGQRMRGDLAAAMLHDPPILYLDEPTIGLDVVAKARVRDFLAHINRERRVTMLLTTHDMADIEYLCQRLVLIDHGRLLYDGDVAGIREQVGTHRTLVIDLDEHDGDVIDERILTAGLEGVHFERRDGSRYWLSFDRRQLSASDLIAALAARVHLRDVAIEEPEIDDIIRRVYQVGIDVSHVEEVAAGAKLAS